MLWIQLDLIGQAPCDKILIKTGSMVNCLFIWRLLGIKFENDCTWVQGFFVVVFLNPSGFSFTLLTIMHFPPCRPDLLLCWQHIWHSRSQGEWHPVCHRGDRCSQCLHDHSCCRYPVWVLLTELWGKELSVGFDDISGRQLLWTVCFSPGVHCGGHWPTASPPLWLRDLLWSLCAAHCRSQLPGTWKSSSLIHHILIVLLCCPLLGQHAVCFFGGILCILFLLLG